MSLIISLGIDEVEDSLNSVGVACKFTHSERLAMTTTPVVNTAGRVLAYPTPSDNEALTLLNLRTMFGTDPRQQPSFFDHPWYLDEGFVTQPLTPGWHMVFMDVVPESVNQPIHYIRSLPANHVFATAAEVILMLFLHYMKTGEQLLFKKHTWCADQASMGRQVTVGAFGRNGVFVSGHPQNYASRGLGICPKVSVSQTLEM